MPLSGATGTKWYCEPPPLAESVQTPRSGLSINPHLKWGSLTLKDHIRERIISENLNGYDFYIYVIPSNNAQGEKLKLIEEMLNDGGM